MFVIDRRTDMPTEYSVMDMAVDAAAAHDIVGLMRAFADILATVAATNPLGGFAEAV